MTLDTGGCDLLTSEKNLIIMSHPIHPT